MKNHIKSFRQQKQLTQEELSTEMDVSRQTILFLENGKYKPSLVLAHKLAQFFDTTIEALFIFEESESYKKRESR